MRALNIVHGAGAKHESISYCAWCLNVLNLNIISPRINCGAL
ncbi:MAG: hypothetical protein ACE1ZG_01280 [Gammaproteobacteria bacterium]